MLMSIQLFTCSKSLLTDFCELCDTSTESYRMVFFDMKSSAASIEPESAYVNLVEKYRFVKCSFGIKYIIC